MARVEDMSTAHPYWVVRCCVGDRIEGYALVRAATADDALARFFAQRDDCTETERGWWTQLRPYLLPSDDMIIL